ncbi:hypothetical protein EUA93_06460 [Nocardioides oleivorans]|uniref:Uncharacterized protein n=1 Tax=Nocardioides oleivorans TaxID=273676 RepID=A0A4Q2S125_9ACTN|nr:hypothetical protein [Nocardioides oleivorans]RYB94024.1 hypothetical protein EUA93_06460 [Nocardioides oleivorans]
MNGRVRILVAGKGGETVRLRKGSFDLTSDEFGAVGEKVVSVRYLGSDLLKRSTDKVRFRVIRS